MNVITVVIVSQMLMEFITHLQVFLCRLLLGKTPDRKFQDFTQLSGICLWWKTCWISGHSLTPEILTDFGSRLFLKDNLHLELHYQLSLPFWECIHAEVSGILRSIPHKLDTSFISITCIYCIFVSFNPTLQTHDLIKSSSPDCFFCFQPEPDAASVKHFFVYSVGSLNQWANDEFIFIAGFHPR
jgi:hypothetical protein